MLVGSSVQRDRSTVWSFDAAGKREEQLTPCGTVLSADRMGHGLVISFTDPRNV